MRVLEHWRYLHGNWPLVLIFIAHMQNRSKTILQVCRRPVSAPAILVNVGAAVQKDCLRLNINWKMWTLINSLSASHIAHVITLNPLYQSQWNMMTAAQQMEKKGFFRKPCCCCTSDHTETESVGFRSTCTMLEINNKMSKKLFIWPHQFNTISVRSLRV